eukprot:TRINITY_DN8426_c0_g1_i2.p1 TRINITY_DN8426_c0_g1~~TRINITY_DN8426_c0_g1_i2.p1  ORF type:complete len:773 (+),score=136.81 TRINITY_DN8426_c0_g1_i2:64-2319(+)
MECKKAGAWTQWGKLRQIVVGRVPDDAPFAPVEPNYNPELNDPHVAKIFHGQWPHGAKPKAAVQKANACLDKLVELLEANAAYVWRSDDGRIQTVPNKSDAPQSAMRIQKHRVEVLRPQTFKNMARSETPLWSSVTQSGNGCPRDVMITIGPIFLEATMSKRSRIFERWQYRDIVRQWRKADEQMLHKSAPFPELGDDSFDESFWGLSDADRLARQHRYSFVINEKEPLFDAADITRVGKDVFVQKSMTTNDAGMEWLRRELASHGIRVNVLHFPYDLTPSHIDCTFVPLRPPVGLEGPAGIALYNPDRPPLVCEMAMWYQNNWRVVPCPEPASDERPCFSQSSRWLSMNLLSISPECVIIEENEVALYECLTALGFDVLTVPFRDFYEFGGSLHCATWDTVREDECVDYFPDRCEDNAFNEGVWDTKLVIPGHADHPFAKFRHFPASETRLLHEYTCSKALAKEQHVELASDHTATWKDGATTYSEFELRINDLPVMEAWERPFMHRLADAACSSPIFKAQKKPFRVLEVGWGLGLSGFRIQNYKHAVSEHHVIEANRDVLSRLHDIATRENDKHDVDGTPRLIVHEGLWKDVVNDFKPGMFDAIMYDAYPQDRSTQHTHQFDFIAQYRRFLRTGGIFVYCNLTSIGERAHCHAGDLNKLFDEEHRPLLEKAGFRSIARPAKYQLPESAIEQRGTCEYYMLDACMVPVVINYGDESQWQEPEESRSLKRPRICAGYKAFWGLSFRACTRV